MANELAKTEPTKELGWTNQPLDLTHLSMNQLNHLGKVMAASGMFSDLKDASSAIVKILAGQEIGITPFQAVTNIAIIQGKPTLGANLYAAKVKSHPKYDYRSKLSSKECTITIYEKLDGKREEIGTFTYSMDDATRQGLAGKDNWKKYPQNMLFARAISNAVRLYAPDVFNGSLVYVPDEMGAETDEAGEVIHAAVEAPPAEEEPEEAEEAEVAEPKHTAKDLYDALKERGIKDKKEADRIILMLAGVDKKSELDGAHFKGAIEALADMDEEVFNSFFREEPLPGQTTILEQT